MKSNSRRSCCLGVGKLIIPGYDGKHRKTLPCLHVFKHPCLRLFAFHTQLCRNHCPAQAELLVLMVTGGNFSIMGQYIRQGRRLDSEGWINSRYQLGDLFQCRRYLNLVDQPRRGYDESLDIRFFCQGQAVFLCPFNQFNIISAASCQ